MKRVSRSDYGAIRKGEPTPQGGLCLAAYPTRVGVLTYLNEDGTTRRELRPPQEVFAVNSLASLANAPLTDRHPSGQVTPETYRAVVRGHVLNDVREAEDRPGHVACTVAVLDGEMLSLIDNGERNELSCGYTCELLEESGEYEGEAYDSVQKNIVYNHLALLAPGEARGGPTCALRLDSNVRVDGLAHDSSKKKDTMTKKKNASRNDASNEEMASALLAIAKKMEPKLDFTKLNFSPEQLLELIAQKVGAATEAAPASDPAATDEGEEMPGEEEEEEQQVDGRRGDSFDALRRIHGVGFAAPRKKPRSYADAREQMRARIQGYTDRTVRQDDGKEDGYRQIHGDLDARLKSRLVNASRRIH